MAIVIDDLYGTRPIDPVTGLETKIRPKRDLPYSEYPYLEAEEKSIGPVTMIPKGYEFPVVYPEDYEDIQARAQSVRQRLLYGVGRVLGTTATKFVTDVGYIAGLIGVDNSYQDNNWITGAADNFLVKLGESMEEGIKEALPIYKTREYMEGNAFQQMGTVSFWTDEFADALAFSMSMWIPGIGLSKLGTGVRMASLLNKAFLGTGKTMNLVKGASMIDRLTMTGFMTASEAMWESEDTKRRLTDYYERGVREGTIMPDPNYKEIIASQSADTFKENLLALAFSNFVEAGFLLPKASLAEKIARRQVPWIEKGTTLTKISPEGFDRFIKGVGGKTLQGAVANILLQGPYEEAIQAEIQNINYQDAVNIFTDKLRPDADLGLVHDMEYAMTHMLDYDDQDKIKSVVSGMVLGAMLGGPSSYVSAKETSRLEDSYINTINKGYQNYLSFNDVFKKKAPVITTFTRDKDNKYWEQEETIDDSGKAIKRDKVEITRERYEREAEKNEKKKDVETFNVRREDYLVDDNNRRIVDQEKYSNYIKHYDHIAEIDDIIDLAREEGDHTKAELFHLKLLGEIAKGYLNVGRLDDLRNKLKEDSKLDAQQRVFYGLDPTADPSENLRKGLSFLDKIEQTYKIIERSVVPLGRTTKDAENYNKRKKLLYQTASLLYSAENVLQKEQDRLSELDRLIPTKAKEEEKYKHPIEEEKRIQQVKIDGITKAINDLTDKWNKLIDPIKGESYMKKIEDEYTASMSTRKDAFPVNDKTDVKDYDSYVNRRLKKDKLVNAIDVVKDEYNNIEVSDRLKEDPLVETIDYVLKNEIKINEDNYDEITERIIGDISREREYENRSIPKDDLDYETLTDEQKVINDEMLSVVERLKKDRPLKDRFLNVDKNNIVRDNTRLLTDDELRRNIADEYVRNSDVVINQFNSNPGYHNTDEIERNINILSNISRIHKEKGDDKNDSFIRPYSFFDNIDKKLDRLNKILVEARVRKESRDAKDHTFLKKNIEDNYNAIGIDIDESIKQKKLVFNEHLKNVYDNIVEVIGDKIKAIEKAIVDIVNSKDISYWKIRGVYESLIEFIKEAKSKDVINNINNNISYDSSLSRVVRNNKRLLRNANITDIEAEIRSYLSNPIRYIVSIMERMKSRDYDGSNTQSSINIFLSTHDYDDFLVNLDKETRAEEDKKALKEFLQIHGMLVGLHQLKANIEADIDMGIQMKSEIAFAERDHKKDSNSIVPNGQQTTVIRQLLRWWNNKKISKLFGNIIIVNGEAGTGKSTVVIDQFKRHQPELNSNNIFATGPGRSASVISKTIGSVTRSIDDLVDAFKDGKIKDYGLIIVDEFYSLSWQTQKDIINAYSEYSKDNKPIRMILLGDANQLSSKGVNLLLHLTHEDQRWNDIQKTDTLTIVYRTDVSAITNIADIFKYAYNNVIGRLSLKSNSKSPLDDNNALEGIYGTNDTINFVERLISRELGSDKTKNRTRVIIVHSSDVDRYTSAFKEEIEKGVLDILPHDGTSGIEVDEVYVDIDLSKIGSPSDVNKTMYTAITRAKHFVVIGNHSYENYYDPVIDDLIKAKKEKKDVYKDYIEDHNKELDAYHSIIEDEEEESKTDEVVATDKISEKDDKDKDVDKEEDAVVTGSIEATEGEVVETVPLEHYIDDEGDVTDDTQKRVKEHYRKRKITTGIHRLVYPFYKAFKTQRDTDTPEYISIQGEQKVYYVKEYLVDDTGRAIIGVSIITETEPDRSGRSRYRKIGTVGEADLPYFTADSNIYKESSMLIQKYRDKNYVFSYSELSKALKFNYVEGTQEIVFTLEGINKLDDADSNILATGIINTLGTNRLTYLYDYKKERRANIKDIFNRWKRRWLYRDDADTEFDDEDNLKRSLFVKIYTQEEVEQINNTQDFVLHPGIPYLVIINPKVKGDDRRITKTQYIQLNPRKINYKKDKSLLSPLITFTDKGELDPDGTGFFNMMYKVENLLKFEYKEKGKSKTFGYGNLLFDKLINKLSKVEASSKKKGRRYDINDKKLQIFFDKDFEKHTAIKDLLMPLLEQNFDVLVDISKKIVELHHYYETLTDVEGKEYEKRKHGKAKKIWDAIARSNLMPGGVVIRKQNPQYIDNRPTKLPVFDGKNLLQEEALQSSFESDIFYKVIDRLTRRLGVKEINRHKLLNHIRRPITMDDVKKIFRFDDKGDSVAEEGFSFRFPINANVFNNLSIEEQVKHLTSSFEDILPTSITVVIDDMEQKKVKEKIVVEEEKEVTKEREEVKAEKEVVVEETVKKPSLETDTIMTSAYGKINKEQAIDRMKKVFGDQITDEEIQFVDALVMYRVMNGIDAVSAIINNIIYMKTDDMMVEEEDLRHEIFHRLWDTVLTEEERQYIRKIANKPTYADSDFAEWIADKYAKHKSGKEIAKGWLYRIINKILRFFGFVKYNYDNLNRFFDLIDNGYYSGKNSNGLNIDRPLLTVIKNYGGHEQYMRARDIFLEEIKKVLYGEDKLVIDDDGVLKGVVLTPTEIFQRLPDILTKRLESVQRTILNKPTPDAIMEESTLLSLLKTSHDGKLYNLDDMVDSVFQNRDIDTDYYDNTQEQIEEDIEDEDVIIEEDEEGDNVLKNVIAEQTLTDHEKEVSWLVKEFASTIFDDRGELIPYNIAYRQLIDILSGLNIGAELEKNIQRRLAGVKGYGRNIAKAVLGIIEQKNKLKPLNIGFRNEDQFAFTDDDKFDVVNSYYTDLYKNNGIVIDRKNEDGTYKSSEQFYIDIVNNAGIYYFLEKIGKKSNIDKLEYIKELNKILTAKNVFIELLTHLGSLYRRNPMRGTQGYDQGVTYKYSSPGEFPVYAATQSKIAYNIKSAILRNPKNKLLNKANVEDDVQFITRIINKLELNPQKIKMEFDNPSKLSKDIQSLFSSIRNVKDEDIDDVLTDQSRRIMMIAHALSKYDKMMHSTTYKSGDGKSRFYYSLSNTGIDIINYIIDKGKNILLPRYLKDKFFERNPFNPLSKLKVKNEIIELVNHDAIDYETLTIRPKVYVKENINDYIRRVLMYGFDSMLSKDINSYIQFLWTISERPEPIGLEIKLIKESQLRELIYQALYQEAERVNPADDVKYQVDNYIDNYDNSYFPIKDNKREDGTYKRLTIEELNDEKRVKEVIDDIIDQLYDDAEKVLDIISSEHLKFDKSLDKVYKSLSEAGFITKQPTSMFLKSKRDFNALKSKKAEYDKYIEELKKYYRPLLYLFYLNDSINGYFLTQMMIGDHAFYKGNADITKRLGLIFAPKYKGYTGLGSMPNRYNVIVVKDIIQKTKEAEELKEYLRHLDKEYEETNSQVFQLPELYDLRRNNFSKKLNLGLVQKSVYAGIDDDNIPRMIKSSTIVLTDKFVDRFPTLNRWRDKMRETGNMELVFHTAFKVGSPKEEDLSYIDDDNNLIYNEKSSLTLIHDNYGIQFNPQMSINKKLKTPGPTLFNLNANGKNDKEAKHIFDILGKLIAFNRKKFYQRLGIKNGDVTYKTKGRLRKLLIDLYDERQRTQIDSHYLSVITDSLDAEGNPIVIDNEKQKSFIFSIDHPQLVDTNSIQFASLFNKNIVRETGFKGAHIVLQTEAGTRNELYDKLGYEGLKYRNENGCVECYMSDIYEDIFDSGDILYGFRIPGSGLHMNVALQIKDFYPSDLDSVNIIIVPHQMIIFQDIDFDVDEIHVIRYEASPIDITDPFGTQIAKKDTIDLYYKDKSMYKFIEEEMRSIKKMINESVDEDGTKELLAYIKKLEVLYPISLRNEANRSIIEILTADRNKDNLYIPIMMDRIKGTSPDTSESIFSMIRRLTKKDVYDPINYLFFIDKLNISQNNNTNRVLKGRYNNYFKGLAYIFQTGDRIELDDEYKIRWKGADGSVGVYDTFNATEKIVKNSELIDNEIILGKDDKGEIKKHIPRYNETEELYITSSIDAIKLRVNEVINNNFMTSDVYSGAIALGFPLDRQVKIMLQPVMISYAQKKTNLRDELITKYLGRAYDKERDAEYILSLLDEIVLSDMDLDKMIMKDISDLDKKQLLLQIKVYDTAIKQLSHIGKGVSTVGLYLSILRTFPVTMSMIKNKLKTLKNIYSGIDYSNTNELKEEYDVSRLPFKGFNLLSNNFIYETTRSLIDLNNIMSKLIRKHNTLIRGYMNSIRSYISDRSYGGVEFVRNEEENISRYVDEFMKFLISGIKFKVEDKTIDLSTVNEEPYEYNDTKNNGRYLDATEAWNQKFFERLKKIQDKHPDNSFLRNVNISYNKQRKVWRMTFLVLRNASDSIRYEFREGFNKLRNDDGTYSDIQLDLFKYAIINHGLRMSDSTFNIIFNEDMYVDLNNKIEMLYQMFTENTKENKDRLEALKEYFTVNFLLNNIEYMKDKSEHVVFDVKPGNVYSGVDTVKLDDGTKRDVYYDTKIEVTEANEESNIFDKFIKGFNNTLLIRLDVDGITEDGKRFVYYKEYGKKHFHGYYYYNPEMISSWNLDDVLFPFAKVVSVYDNTKTTFWMSQNTKDQPQIGDIVVLRRYSDLIRQDLRTGKIIDRKDEQGKIIYTLDKNVKVNIDNVNDNNNIDDIAEETDTEKKCIT